MEISKVLGIYINAYNYDLPDQRIAKYPLSRRDQSKLLVFGGGHITDASFGSLAQYVPAGSLMIFNNTRVIQARMHFRKDTGALIEIFCLEPSHPHDYLLNFQQREFCSWKCLIGNLKKWKEGALTQEVQIGHEKIRLTATKTGTEGDAHIVAFAWDNSNISFADILSSAGELPIPPYLNRDTEERDKDTYQTVYSKIDGSVAAPTAGLHFTDAVFESLAEKGIKRDEVTLHVGAGTFKPVKSATIEGHEMHSELIAVRRDTIKNLLEHEGAVIAVGTTSVRTLESLYYIGEILEREQPGDLRVGQWQAYQPQSNNITKQKALQNILDYLDGHKLDVLLADTQIIIAPGYEFKIVGGIVTNFHQPQSTLLLLVSAFVGGNYWHTIYDHALANDYRFLSYGDTSLLLKK